MTEEHLIFAAGALLAASVGASLLAARLRVPALLLFLGVGMAVGSDGAGWIAFENYDLARELGLVALALILFDGGLNSSFSDVRKVLSSSLRLAVGGTVIVAVVTGVFASAILGLSLPAAFLIGSMLASTDSAAVFGLLRGSTLRRRLVHTMEAEAAFNDAVVLVLVLGFVAWIQQPGSGIVDMVVLSARELAVGGVCGVVVAKGGAILLSRARLPKSGLAAVASFSLAAVAYGAATSLHGSGLLAVYLTGVLLADAALPGRRTITAFHDGAAWVAQVGLFLMLGLLVSPNRIGPSFSSGAALALVVVLFARPLATIAMTSRREFTLREQLVLSWAELLGATPLVFASLAVASGVPGSGVLFDLVFVAVVVSTLLQGLTFEPFARALGLTTVAPLLPRPLAEFGGPRRLGAELVEYTVSGSDGVVGRRVRALDLPLGITLTLIVRDEEAVSPAHSTRLKAGDTLHFLVRQEVADRIPELLERLREPGAEPRLDARPDGDGGLRDLVTEPWSSENGNPADPDLLGGVLVVERLRARNDRRGALVVLEDGRYAVTGATVAIGPAEVVRRYANRLLARAATADDEQWWRDVAAAMRR
jgi:cell volume regulation protein A